MEAAGSEGKSFVSPLKYLLTNTGRSAHLAVMARTMGEDPECQESTYGLGPCHA